MERKQLTSQPGVATSTVRRARQRIPTTDNWQQLELLCATPGQRLYEVIRPVLLFGQPLAERTAETATQLRSVQRNLAGFDAGSLAGPESAQHRFASG